MNNRFTLQDLAGILATQTGRTRKESEEFLREFITVVVEGAFTDKIVKVKGLGTFKVIEVEDRESVNVNTGKRFIIPGHYKFNFTPDKELKELVNKPFSFFDTTEINTEENLQELIATTEEEESVEIAEEEKEKEEKVNVEPVTSPVETPMEELPAIEPIEPQQKEVNKGDTVKVGTVEQKRNKALLLVILILLVAAVGTIAYLFLHSPEWSIKPSEPIEKIKIEEIKTEPKETQDIIPEPESSGPDQTVSTENNSSDKVLGHETIEPGSRLTLISLEYYQHKIFWVYIYEFNKELIEDPNNIPVGTKLAIPSPEVYGINVNDRESIEKASSLQTQIIAGEK